MERLQAMAQRLQKRGFQATVCETAGEAAAAALALVAPGASAGFGGSITVDGLGVYDTLKAHGHPVYWHWKVDPAERPAIMEQARKADVYFSSANAILQDGTLLNIDGNGNRVASLFYGPGRVVIIAGRNKLCGDWADGVARIKREACPGNARRLGLKTPCGVTGACTDCNSPQRMCNVTVALERPGFVKDVHVILVNEDLGY